VVTLESSSTALMPDAIRAQLRPLLDAAFGGDFTDHDWDHALGGEHVWLTDRNRLISHASIVERTIECGGRRLSVGYVEAVATLASHQRRGHGSIVMGRVGDLIRARYALGALSTGRHPFYERLGWERWLGPTLVRTPHGRQPTPGDDGSVMILRTTRSPAVDIHAEIVCDWREGDVW
jgi:aminoglycoside 2'-N-acetyltransferase I